MRNYIDLFETGIRENQAIRPLAELKNFVEGEGYTVDKKIVGALQQERWVMNGPGKIDYILYPPHDDEKEAYECAFRIIRIDRGMTSGGRVDYEEETPFTRKEEYDLTGVRMKGHFEYYDENDIQFRVMNHNADAATSTKPLAVIVHPGDMINHFFDFANSDEETREEGRASKAYGYKNLQGMMGEILALTRKGYDFAILHRESSVQFPSGNEFLKKVWKVFLKIQKKNTVLYGDDLDRAGQWMAKHLNVANRPQVHLLGAYSDRDHGCLTAIGKQFVTVLDPMKLSVSDFSPPSDCPSEHHLRWDPKEHLEESYRLPMKPDQSARFRGLYAAFVCVMSPKAFLELTCYNSEEREKIMKKGVMSDEEFENLYGDSDWAKPGKFEFPFLMVEFPSGQVRGHEGRHRAAHILNQGGDKMTVMIIPYDTHTYKVTIPIFQGDGYTEVDKLELTFNNKSEADRAAFDYMRKKVPSDPALRYGIGDVDRVESGGVLRGAPARSGPDHWDFAAWKNEDFPKYLLNQYWDFIRVSTSRMKYGPLKGYRHHKV